MIRKSEEIVVRDSENARGGNGTVHFYDWMKPEDAEGHGRLFSKLVVPPGASIGEHQHDGEFEVFYVIEGNPTVIDNGEAVYVCGIDVSDLDWRE
ncbi:MAG: cupin domain-containing protein [Eubacterium sp.]|nr:cupin domain-containing protein [Eubacterium sp.]